MGRACMDETRINSKDRNRKRPLGGPPLRLEDCVTKDVGRIVAEIRWRVEVDDKDIWRNIYFGG